MYELDEIDLKVINLLTFPEEFNSIVEESGEQRNIVADVLKGLMAKDLVVPIGFDSSSSKWEGGYFYDSDNMEDFKYQITAKGLEILF